MKTLIVGGGELDIAFLLRYTGFFQPDLVIAADRGMDYLLEAGIAPDLILGDYDSTSASEQIREFRRRGLPVRTYPCEKDFSDMESAIREAVRLGGTKIRILGACGGRLDHFLANLADLRIALKAGCDAALVNERNFIFLADHSFILEKKRTPWTYVSFLPMGSESVEHITLRGFKYPLTDGTLSQGAASLGISNEITEERAEVSFRDGILIVVLSADETVVG